MVDDASRPSDGPDDGKSPSISIGGDDWPDQAADTIVRVVDEVKTKTTDNVVLIVRAVVYGLVIAVLGIAVLVMISVALVRVLDAYLPIGDGVGSATWAAHAMLGAMLSIIGFGAWLSRRGSNKPLIIAVVLDVAIIIAIVFYGVIDAVN